MDTTLCVCLATVLVPPVPSFANLGARISPSPYHPAQTPVKPVDPTARAKYASKFTRPVPIPIEDLEEVEIIVPKTSRMDGGHKQFVNYQNLATASIEHKFGVASHYVTDKDEAEDGDQTRPQFIQQQYVENLSKIDAVKQRLVEYDMVDVMRVPIGIRDPLATDISDLFEFEDVHILSGWDTVSWETACTWQWAVNSAMSDDDKCSSKWAKMFLHESCTTEMRELIMTEYGALPIHFKGGVTIWIFLLLTCCSSLSWQ